MTIASAVLSKSKAAVLQSSASSVYEPSPARTGREKGSAELDRTYCILADDGMEVLDDKHEIDTESRSKVRRAPSLGNLLKTPSRMALRKATSKLKIATDTPNSRKKLSTDCDVSSHPVPAIPEPLQGNTASRNSTSAKSARSSKSLFRSGLKDKYKQAPDHATVEHPGHDSGAVGLELSVGSGRTKTPKHKWLSRFTLGKSSSKQQSKLDIPAFEAPDFSEQVNQELSRKNQIGECSIGRTHRLWLI